MLYLFYNANLLKSYNNIKLHFNIIKFVNNIIILTYNKLIKQNYKILNKIKSSNEQKDIILSSMNENINWFIFQNFWKDII